MVGYQIPSRVMHAAGSRIVQLAEASYHRGKDFEWDPKKAARNLAKHGVSFHEAGTVFGDPTALTFSDPDHSEDEDRFLTFGHSVDGQLLIVSPTDVVIVSAS
jgi:uncharacterized protein